VTRSFSRPFRAHHVSRRTATRAGLGLFAAAGLPALRAGTQEATPGASPVTADTIAITGEAVPELADVDQVITETMARWSLPGGQVAIARDGRLVFDRGYGHADVEAGEVVEPEHRFRIASTSKPVTAVAILRLVDAGALTLDTPVFPLLALDPPTGAPYDTRLDDITVQHLLLHAGGWNSAAGYDPQYVPWTLEASHVLGAETPAEAATIVRYMLGKPLDFDPGTLSAYSNFGFNVLGRVIEHLSGKTYEQFTLDEVLTPSGIASMAIGGTTLAERMEGEVRYYSPPGLDPRPSVYPGEGFVPVGYGSFYLPSLDAHGGWIAPAHDLVRFALAVDGRLGTALLAPESVTLMETTARPPLAAAGAGNVEGGFGLGWNSATQDGGYEWSHAGALEGSNCSWLVRKPDGTTLAFVFNSLPTDFEAFFGDLIPALQTLLANQTAWPDTDLFETAAT
jgi:N-acyl-D-amino-acid deacylase